MGASSVSYQWQIQPAPTLSFQCSNDCWVSIQQRCIFFSIDSLLTVQFLQEWEHTKTWGSQLYDVTYTIKGSNPRVLDSTTDKGRQKACDAFSSNQSFRFFECQLHNWDFIWLPLFNSTRVHNFSLLYHLKRKAFQSCEYGEKGEGRRARLGD